MSKETKILSESERKLASIANINYLAENTVNDLPQQTIDHAIEQPIAQSVETLADSIDHTIQSTPLSAHNNTESSNTTIDFNGTTITQTKPLNTIHHTEELSTPLSDSWTAVIVKETESANDFNNNIVDFTDSKESITADINRSMQTAYTVSANAPVESSIVQTEAFNAEHLIELSTLTEATPIIDELSVTPSVTNEEQSVAQQAINNIISKLADFNSNTFNTIDSFNALKAATVEAKNLIDQLPEGHEEKTALSAKWDELHHSISNLAEPTTIENIVGQLIAAADLFCNTITTFAKDLWDINKGEFTSLNYHYLLETLPSALTAAVHLGFNAILELIHYPTHVISYFLQYITSMIAGGLGTIWGPLGMISLAGVTGVLVIVDAIMNSVKAIVQGLGNILISVPSIITNGAAWIITLAKLVGAAIESLFMLNSSAMDNAINDLSLSLSQNTLVSQVIGDIIQGVMIIPKVLAEIFFAIGEWVLGVPVGFLWVIPGIIPVTGIVAFLPLFLDFLFGAVHIAATDLLNLFTNLTAVLFYGLPSGISFGSYLVTQPYFQKMFEYLAEKANMPILGSLIKFVTDIFTQPQAMIKDVITSTYEFIKGFLNHSFDLIVDIINKPLELFQFLFNDPLQFIQGLLTNPINTLKGLIDPIIKLISDGVYNALDAIFNQPVLWLKEVIGNVFSFIEEFFTHSFELIVNIINKPIELIQFLFDKPFQLIADFIKDPIGFIKNFIDKSLDFIKDMTSFDSFTKGFEAKMDISAKSLTQISEDAQNELLLSNEQESAKLIASLFEKAGNANIELDKLITKELTASENSTLDETMIIPAMDIIFEEAAMQPAVNMLLEENQYLLTA